MSSFQISLAFRRERAHWTLANRSPRGRTPGRFARQLLAASEGADEARFEEEHGALLERSLTYFEYLAWRRAELQP